MHIKVKKQLSDIGINNISEIVYNPSYDFFIMKKMMKVYQDLRGFKILNMEPLM